MMFTTTLAWCWRNEHHLKAKKPTGSGYFRRLKWLRNQILARSRGTRPQHRLLPQPSVRLLRPKHQFLGMQASVGQLSVEPIATPSSLRPRAPWTLCCTSLFHITHYVPSAHHMPAGRTNPATPLHVYMHIISYIHICMKGPRAMQSGSQKHNFSSLGFPSHV